MKSLSKTSLSLEARRILFFGIVFALLSRLKPPEPFLRSYLFAFVTILGIGVGCLGLLLLHSLVGGAWGKTIRPILQAGADTVPWLAVLFLPVAFGLRHIYPWMDPTRLAVESAAAAHKRLYFLPSFFILRAFVYFFFWSLVAQRQRNTSSGTGWALLVYVLTVSFASFDWVMSLEPTWSSSIYGAMLMVGNVLSALAFSIVVLDRLAHKQKTHVEADVAHDLGNLLLAFVMLWAYMALSQYLIIWSANLPEEIGWYLARQRGGWQIVAIVLILFQFALPFLLLLARQGKRKLSSLAKVAGFILAMRVVDVFWLVAPDFSPGRFSIHVLDFAALLLVGGTWISAFFGRLREGAP